MAKYGKILAWVGPVALPLLVTGIRGLLKKKNRPENPGDDRGQQKDMIDTLVDVGLSGLTRGRGRGRG